MIATSHMWSPEFSLVCRQAQNEPHAQTAEDEIVCNLKAALLLLALVRQLASQGYAADEVSFSLIWAFKCLTAPFAWGKSLQTAITDCDYEKAGASEIMTFAASLQSLDPQHLSGDLLTEKGKVRLLSRGCMGMADKRARSKERKSCSI